MITPNKNATSIVTVDTTVQIYHSDLASFQRLIGMSSTIFAQHPGPDPKPHLGYGAYRDIVIAERAARTSYTWYKHIIRLLFLTQIVLPAITTALAAYSASTHSPTAITISIISTANTIAAGLLAYLKAQGLPQRKRLYKNQLARLREYAEWRACLFRERDIHVQAAKTSNSTSAALGSGALGAGGAGAGVGIPDFFTMLSDPATEADIVEKKFLSAKQDEQDNYPDVYSRNATTVAAERAGNLGADGATKAPQAAGGQGKDEEAGHVYA